MTQPVEDLSHKHIQAAVGAFVGSAVGDALGAPFEFKAAGLYASIFPEPVLGGIGEMVGGGGFNWAPGEFTDDTQMAIALSEAILAEAGTFDPEAVWEHFVAWSHSARDIGNNTRAALAGTDYTTAAFLAHQSIGLSAGNGAVMRIAPIGIAGVRWGEHETVSIARQQAALTHYDEAAGWGAAIVADLIRRLILGDNFESALAAALMLPEQPHREMFCRMLDSAWQPANTPELGNGSVWTCTAQAVWAVRSTSSFEQAVVAAINLGDDADTVAAVTGAIAGALYGIQQIPSRWTAYLHGTVGQPDGTSRIYTCRDLQRLARLLLGVPMQEEVAPERAVGPRPVAGAVHASNLAGAIDSTKSMAVVSLCRGNGNFDGHKHRRELYLIDAPNDENPYLWTVVNDAVQSIDAFLNDGFDVVVHCHGGRSRTGLVLKAWYMRHHQATHDEADQWLNARWELYSTWNDRFTDFLDDEWSAQ
jgi:ADP-ribosyl-[dinitrogen reductase] hydrolase